MDELWFCGGVISPVSLAVLAPLLEPADGRVQPQLARGERVSWPVEARPSGYDGRHVLRARSGPVELDMSAGQGARKLFSGTVAADPDAALRLLGELSDAFREAGMRHRIELYPAPDGPLLGYPHRDWPQEP